MARLVGHKENEHTTPDDTMRVVSHSPSGISPILRKHEAWSWVDHLTDIKVNRKEDSRNGGRCQLSAVNERRELGVQG
jgi:hypothetical protein